MREISLPPDSVPGYRVRLSVPEVGPVPEISGGAGRARWAGGSRRSVAGPTGGGDGPRPPRGIRLRGLLPPTSAPAAIGEIFLFFFFLLRPVRGWYEVGTSSVRGWARARVPGPLVARCGRREAGELRGRRPWRKVGAACCCARRPAEEPRSAGARRRGGEIFPPARRPRACCSLHDPSDHMNKCSCERMNVNQCEFV